jgi:WD40 repeat protein
VGERNGVAVAPARGGGPAHSARFGPRADRAVSADSRRAARAWDAQTGAALAKLRGHTDAVNDAAFTPPGTTILTAEERRRFLRARVP